MRGYTKYATLKELIAIWKNKDVKKGFLNQLISNLLCERENLKRTMEDLLFVINKDKDGSYFICAEAEHTINKLRQTIKEII